jgi:hypothetical protein
LKLDTKKAFKFAKFGTKDTPKAGTKAKDTSKAGTKAKDASKTGTKAKDTSKAGTNAKDASKADAAKGPAFRPPKQASADEVCNC